MTVRDKLLKGEIRKRFKTWQVKHPNFMTPSVEKIFEKDDKIVELSSGRKLFAEGYGEKDLMFGVSPFKFVGGKKQFKSIDEKGHPFFKRTKAEKFALKLLKDL